MSSDREHLGIEQSLHFTHLALHSIIPTVDTLRRRERWQKASKWEHDSHAGTEAYMSDSFRHGASPLSFCTKAYMVCNVIQIIRYFVDRKVSKALPVECEESLVAFPFDARARFRALLRLLGFQSSLMLIGRCDDENHVSEASVV